MNEFSKIMNKKTQNYPARPAGMWLPASSEPPYHDGWYLVVAESHGKRKMVVDYYNSDDVQWQEEHKDDAVSIVYYQKLPEMPD